MLPSIFLGFFMLRNYYNERICEYGEKQNTEQPDLFPLGR